MAVNNITTEDTNYSSASLYVDNLHPDVTEAMLFDKFASAGPVLSIRVCRDMITRRSLGYAYVNFQRPEDAERAIDTMNFDLLRGRQLRIMWANRDPALRKSGVGNVFIKNLDKNIDNKSLYDTFSAFGNILSSKIMTDENGQSKGFGFIHFETQKAADNAIDKVNGMLLADKKVYVGRFMTRNERADVTGPRKYTNIFIKNFGDEMDEEKLRELLSKYGNILSFKFETDEHGHSKGFAFCSFENPEEAEEAVKNLNGYSIGDKELYIGRFQKKDERLAEMKRKRDLQRQERIKKYQGINLYIKNLDDTIDDERLREEFSKFGTVTSAKVMSADGRSRGFGFVCFTTPEEAIKAITMMNGSTVGSKPLYVALAQRKEERRMHLTNERIQRIATSTVPPQMQLPFPNLMGGMTSYLLTPIGPSPSRNFYPPTGLPNYRPTPWWSGAGMMQPQTNPQMIGMQMMSNGPVRPQATFTHTARNVPSTVVPGQEPLTPAALANATLQEQQQMLGERLFPLIQQIQPELASKLTGMLLELDNTELLHLLSSRESLKAKIEEAIATLQVYQARKLYADTQTQRNT